MLDDGIGDCDYHRLSDGRGMKRPAYEMNDFECIIKRAGEAKNKIKSFSVRFERRRRKRKRVTFSVECGVFVDVLA